ncbi:MAG: hypothetical protein ABIE42_02895 [Candidatus Eisenbacteria bacterium]
MSDHGTSDHQDANMSDRHIDSHRTAGVAADGASPAPGLHARGSRRELLVGLLLLAAVFVFHFVLESKLRAMGAFACLNTLFSADPGLTLEAICSGGGSNHLSHPLLEYLFSIPIGVVAKLGSLISSGGLDEVLTRGSLGLLVVPAAAGLQTFVSLRILRTLGLSLRSALLLALLGSLSFSKLLLGSMPESYCLSALCISLGYLLFLRTRDRRGVRVELSWIALGVLTAGITVTNVAALAILYFVRERQLGRNLPGGSLRTAGMAVLVLVVTLACGQGLDRLFDAQPGRTPDEMVWISRYLVDDPGIQLATFPTAVINGIAPPVPSRKPNNFALRMERSTAKDGKAAAPRRPARRRARGPGIRMPGAATENDTLGGKKTGPVFLNREARAKPDPASADAAPEDTTDPAAAGAAPEDTTDPAPADAAPEDTAGPAQPDRVIPFSMTLQRTHDPRSVRNFIGIVLLATLACVALRDKRLDPTFRSLARASLAILAFNWILHGFWGGEQFLYSQHWHVSLLVLMGAAVSVLEARGRNALTPLVICVVGVAVSNSIVLTKTMQALLDG